MCSRSGVCMALHGHTDGHPVSILSRVRVQVKPKPRLDEDAPHEALEGFWSGAGQCAREVVGHEMILFFFFQAEDGIRDVAVTGVQTCALPIWDGNSLCALWVLRPLLPSLLLPGSS